MTTFCKVKDRNVAGSSPGLSWESDTKVKKLVHKEQERKSKKEIFVLAGKVMSLPN